MANVKTQTAEGSNEGPGECSCDGAAHEIAKVICMEDACGCSEAWAPCERAASLAAKIIKALEAYGVSEYQMNGIADGDLGTCDGYCHDNCG